jgi:hypothetical protein
MIVCKNCIREVITIHVRLISKKKRSEYTQRDHKVSIIIDSYEMETAIREYMRLSIKPEFRESIVEVYLTVKCRGRCPLG